jgi:hypothetical protein
MEDIQKMFEAIAQEKNLEMDEVLLNAAKLYTKFIRRDKSKDLQRWWDGLPYYGEKKNAPKPEGDKK